MLHFAEIALQAVGLRSRWEGEHRLSAVEAEVAALFHELRAPLLRYVNHLGQFWHSWSQSGGFRGWERS